MIKKIVLLALMVLMIGFLMWILSPFIGALSIIIVSGASAFLILFINYIMPRLAYEAWKAEEENGILILLHGDDHRIVPLSAYYYKQSNIVQPITRLKKLVFVPDPDSTLPVLGHKMKLALAYINSPFLVKPDMILVAYDLKRMGLENLGQAIEYDEYYKNIEDLKQKIKEYEEFYEELRKYDYDNLPDELRENLPEEAVESQHAYYTYLENLKKYIDDMKHVVELAMKKKIRKPIVKIGARIYTVKDIIGYLGYHININKLANIIENARLQERIKLRSEAHTYMKYGVLILFAFIGLIALIFALNFLSGHAAMTPQIPLPTPATPTVQHVNVTG